MVGKLSVCVEELPKQLSKEEIYQLLERVRCGDRGAREKVIIHNMRLVVYRVLSRFSHTNYEVDDLVSIGNIALLNAVDSYDATIGIEFTTYASKCIDNLILNFMKVNKKHQVVSSFDDIIYCDKYGKHDRKQDIRFVDAISDDYVLEDAVIQKEEYRVIRELIDELSERDKIIVTRLCGFQGNIVYTQKSVAAMLGIPQSNFSRLKNKIVKYLETRLEEEDIINIHKRVLKKY